jgi:DNA-binding PadR family transcriptional regulator
MHPYELQSIIKLTHKDDFLHLNPGSLYNSIERLLKAGLIEVAQTVRSGRRPERTVYRITRKGSHEASQWLKELLKTPSADSNWFFAALSFLPALQPAEVSRQLQKRVAVLQDQIRRQQEVLATITPRVGRLNLIELEFSVALRSAELRWIEGIVAELNSGDFHWDPEKIRKYASEFLKPSLPARTCL